MSDLAGLVSLASFLATHPRITVEEAARATHRTRKQLFKDMKALMMVGAPPYAPSDYIGYAPLTAEKNSLITIQYADHFRRPPNFTLQEGLALKFALDHFALTADAETRREIDALAKALADMLYGRAAAELAAATKGFVQRQQTERVRALMADMTQAGEQRRKVEIEYFSAHRGALSRRVVHPYNLLESGAHFYLFAWCELARATRHFRVDRVRAATVLSESFDERPPRQGAKGKLEPVFSGQASEALVIEFIGDAAQEIEDEWADVANAKVKRSGKKAVLEMPLFNDSWAVGFAMGYGNEARIVKPLRLREAFKQTVERTLNAHG